MAYIDGTYIAGVIGKPETSGLFSDSTIDAVEDMRMIKLFDDVAAIKTGYTTNYKNALAYFVLAETVEGLALRQDERGVFNLRAETAVTAQGVDVVKLKEYYNRMAWMQVGFILESENVGDGSGYYNTVGATSTQANTWKI